MTDQPDPNIFTPQPTEEPGEEFDFTKIIRDAGEPISVGPYVPDANLFDELTKAVTIPGRFAQPFAEEEPVALELAAYPPDKPRYDNIRARLYNP